MLSESMQTMEKNLKNRQKTSRIFDEHPTWKYPGISRFWVDDDCWVIKMSRYYQLVITVNFCRKSSRLPSAINQIPLAGFWWIVDDCWWPDRHWCRLLLNIIKITNSQNSKIMIGTLRFLKTHFLRLFLLILAKGRSNVLFNLVFTQ